MRFRSKRWAQRITIVVLAVFAVFLLLPWLTSALRAGIGITLAVVYLLAYLFAIIVLPLTFFALMKFAYSVFARPYVRAWHINRIRNARHLKEVIRRGRDGE